MSLITCCPACQTMFRVVPDQLRISEGWVRCGHCSEVFDAAAHLQTALPGPQLPDPPAAGLSPALEADTSPMGLDVLPEPALNAAPGATYPPFVLKRESEGPAAPQIAAPAAARAPAPPLPPASVPAARSGPLSRPPGHGGPSSVLGAPSSVMGGPRSVLDDDADPALSDLGFVRQARREAYWRRPGPRVLLALVALLLATLLAGQFALQERDRLAAMFPQIKPGMDRLCEVAACAIAAPRQIDAIVIDASTFTKMRGDAYRLSFTLKNQGAYEVAIPAVELTLTDTQDQPVLRRVLLPAEFAAGSNAIGGASDKPATVAIAVAAGTASSRIAGYRLLAFYP
jgi:predicted Zn finger-like uncharacterized protein